jgi:hypothetical protein
VLHDVEPRAFVLVGAQQSLEERQVLESGAEGQDFLADFEEDVDEVVGESAF